MVRNIIGQPKSTFNLRQIMDQGKILIVNLSRGLMGEDNAGILGAMMVTKIQLSAMGRANVPQEQRRPFYLYVDEFQNFATDSFAVILSEARKYNLFLTVANQYISQMAEPVRDAVFGNVGTIITFRVSPDDAPFLKKYFEPQFEEADLNAQHNRYFVITMMIGGEKAPPFSAKTLNLPVPAQDSSAEIIDLSRQRYAQERPVVEGIVRRAAGLAMDRQPAAASGQSQPMPARPKAQAQLQRAQKAQPTHQPPKDIGKVAAAAAESSEQPPSHKRRRRRSRGKKPTDQTPRHQPAKQESRPPAQPNAKITSDDQEMVIRLR
jgi:hypothetical protein